MIESKPNVLGAEVTEGKSRRYLSWAAVALVVGVTLALMWKPMHDDSATIDEANFFGAGYTYWQGQRYFLNCDHPPLMQLWSALPLLFLDVKMPPQTQEFFDLVFDENEERWDHKAVDRTVKPVPGERFYHYPLIETGSFGNRLLYGKQNDADVLLFWGRLMQAIVMLVTGVMVFVWARSLSSIAGGLLALVAWCFNPLALAYGHLVITDPGIALMLPLAVWMFARFLESPHPRAACWAGLALGGALLTKFTGIVLIPVFVVMLALAWWRLPTVRELHVKRFLGNLLLVGVIAWATVLLLYAPNWLPAPSLSTVDAERLKVPLWFVRLRWFLIPAQYFKGLALVLLHTERSQETFFLGKIITKGSWCYYPVAILIKTPAALLAMMSAATIATLSRTRTVRFSEIVPLAAATVYLGCAMLNNATIGIRHILPIYPLLAIVVGTQFGRLPLRWQPIGWTLVAWLMIVAFLARSDYITYFNEIIGGPSHGHLYLVDSNLDWGQSLKRLKRWTQQNHIDHIYLDLVQARAEVQHFEIPCDLVTAEQARQLREGLLVVSASHLMLSDYAWLRTNRVPTARIGNTLFVYSMSGSSADTTTDRTRLR